MQHAVDCWLELSPEQRTIAYKMHGIGCTGHAVNLTTEAEDTHRKSETTAISANMVNDLAARVVQRLILGWFHRKTGGDPKIPPTLEPTKALEPGYQGPVLWGRVHPWRRLLILKGYVGATPAFSAGPKPPEGGRRTVRLVPAGKHLNGGELPAVGDVRWKVSKLLFSDGEHHTYYLNEHRAFHLFAKMRLFKTCRLLSVKGSHQNITVQ
jgi:hypothetical protein